jgi:nitrogen fixation protein NifQ
MDARTLYRTLMAGEDRFTDFSRHVLACPLTLALTDHVTPPFSSLGLSPPELSALVLTHFGHAAWLLAHRMESDGQDDRAGAIEEPDLRDLLIDNASSDKVQAYWLSRIIARRCLCSNHLWQDLGLADRSDLSRLMRVWFPGLADLNAKDMRWKKFFYRELCKREDVQVCKSPVCESCTDHSVCFGAEDGISLLARIA